MNTRFVAPDLLHAAVVIAFAAVSIGAPSTWAQANVPSAKELQKKSPAKLLQKATDLYDALEYDRVIPYAAALLAREDATVDQQLDAYLLQGSALAIVGDPIEAETPFRFLLRGRPSFDLPPETPPKILAVFRKVQVEEKAIVETTRELRRQRIVRSLSLDYDRIDSVDGGVPIRFDLKLKDARGAVAAIRVLYRRQGERAWSALALLPSSGGKWEAEIPGASTANDDGFVLEYYVATADGDGDELLLDGTVKKPYRIQVAPGEVVSGTAPFYQSIWFWGAAGVVVVAAAAGVGGYAFISSLPPQGDLGVLQLD